MNMLLLTKTKHNMVCMEMYPGKNYSFSGIVSKKFPPIIKDIIY